MTDDELDDEDLQDFILTAVSEFESSIRIPVSPVRNVEKFDFKRPDDMEFSPHRLARWPLLKVEKLEALWPGRAEGQEYSYPTDWVTTQEDNGLIRIVPTSGSINNADANFVFSITGRALALGGQQMWPNVWRITYVAGFENDKIPHIVNHCIGVMAAIAVLSQMGPAIFPINSFGVGIDGLSQSTGNAGPQWLSQRLQELTAERDKLTMQLKAHYGTDLQFTAF
jgi:hypothetical protein